MWAVIAGEIIGMVIGLALVFAYFVRQVVRTERRYGKPGRVLDAVRYLLGRKLSPKRLTRAPGHRAGCFAVVALDGCQYVATGVCMLAGPVGQPAPPRPLTSAYSATGYRAKKTLQTS